LIKKIDLFCLPFGGGNKYAYKQYEACKQPGINLVTLEYPGRASRSPDPLCTHANQLAEDMYGQLKKQVGKTPYALYGHSMGGLMVHLIARKIIAAGEIAPPVYLFVSGCAGPSSRGRLGRKVLNRYLMPKEQLLDEVRRLEGIPREMLQDPELMDYIEPIMRADFEVSETYVYEPGEPYNIPLMVITGTKESFEQEDIRAWQQETLQPVVFKQMPGTHFFITTYPGEMMATMARAIQTAHGLVL
jgi:surfactin synthase thioesterase subunit